MRTLYIRVSQDMDADSLNISFLTHLILILNRSMLRAKILSNNKKQQLNKQLTAINANFLIQIPKNYRKI